jgi:hypothetical protein
VFDLCLGETASLEAEGDILVDRRIEQERGLMDEADFLTKLRDTVGGYRLASVGQHPLRGIHEPCENLEERGLARSVWAHDGGD